MGAVWNGTSKPQYLGYDITNLYKFQFPFIDVKYVAGTAKEPQIPIAAHDPLVGNFWRFLKSKGHAICDSDKKSPSHQK